MENDEASGGDINVDISHAEGDTEGMIQEGSYYENAVETYGTEESYGDSDNSFTVSISGGNQAYATVYTISSSGKDLRDTIIENKELQAAIQALSPNKNISDLTDSELQSLFEQVMSQK